MKKKPGYFYSEIYKANFWFFLGWKTLDVEKFMSKHFVFETLSLIGDGRTIVLENENGKRITMIWTKHLPLDSKDYGVLAHECSHAAHFALNHIGFKSDFINDEPVSYLIEALMRKSLESIE